MGPVKATDQLLKDHKMIRKILEDFSLDNPRYPQLFKTLARTVLGHAWFEDQIFLPVIRKESRLWNEYLDEISKEHQDLDHFFLLAYKMGPHKSKELEMGLTQIKAVLRTHLTKEEDGLFPLAEKILDHEGQNKLGQQMEKRKTEVREVVALYQ